jgi:hypothetical protein
MERCAKIAFSFRQDTEKEHQQTHEKQVTYNSGNELNVTELSLELWNRNVERSIKSNM